MTRFFNSKGQPISLGQQLGKGGEGTVYEVPASRKGIVAKIYHESLPIEKKEKLIGMIKARNEQLEKLTAWPLDTLHQGSTQGEICGFLMAKATGYEPIHHFYSPTDRKQRFPEKDWAFLVHVARNIAVAFYAIHRYGHVIGDVNPNFVFVNAKSALVKLVDCDSFQISVDHKHYLCEVGVPHFTPPELQTHSTFRGVQRSPNHDNFGLALLIFHILMMGRHPFSGIPTKGDMLPLEKSISQFYYAFGKNAVIKGVKPPPNSVTPIILPENVATLFERAFTEKGIHGSGRPSAREWVITLDSLRQQLSTCGQVSNHKYFRGLKVCPWCELEQRSGILFFIHLITPNTFDLAGVWAKITAISSPGQATFPHFANITVVPKGLPTTLLELQRFVQKLEGDMEKKNMEIENIERQAKIEEEHKIRERDKIQIEESLLLEEKKNVDRIRMKTTWLLVLEWLGGLDEKKRQIRQKFLARWPNLDVYPHIDLDFVDEVYQQELKFFSKKKTQIDAEIEQTRRSYQEKLVEKTRWLQELLVDEENRLKENMRREEQIRQQALNIAQSQLAQLKNRWNLETSDKDFREKFEELSNSRTEYETLLKQFTQERQILQQNARNSQLNKFLSSFFIKDNKIPHIGPSRNVTLASFGIETAADIEQNKIANIPKFGQRPTRELVNWRNSLERRFVFDPSKGIDPTDIAALNQRFALRRKQLEGALLAGSEQLTQIRQQILQQRTQLLAEIENAARQVKQAEADLTVFN